MYGELKDMLLAWVVSRSDEGLGYVHRVARIAAMILLNMPASPGFVVMKNFLERHCMRSFYGESPAKDDVSFYIAPHSMSNRLIVFPGRGVLQVNYSSHKILVK